jgi:ribosome maturation factor RimP
MDITHIQQLVTGKLQGTDAFLVDVKLSLNRIGISIDKPTGITIEECAQVSRYVAAELENSGMLETRELEVGSPGMDQPLKVYQQYLRRIGRKLSVMTPDGKLHNGILKEANENTFTLFETIITKQDNKKVKTEQDVVYNYSDIKETKLEITFSKIQTNN